MCCSRESQNIELIYLFLFNKWPFELFSSFNFTFWYSLSNTIAPKSTLVGSSSLSRHYLLDINTQWQKGTLKSWIENAKMLIFPSSRRISFDAWVPKRLTNTYSFKSFSKDFIYFHSFSWSYILSLVLPFVICFPL